MAIASPKNKEELVRQFRFNPEINTRLEAFMKAEPGLVQFIKELPREQLERKFLLRKMHDEQRRQGYDAKVKAWLESPEQAELVQSLKATVSPEIKPEQTGPDARQPGQELYPQHGYKDKLTPQRAGFPLSPARIQF